MSIGEYQIDRFDNLGKYIVFSIHFEDNIGINEISTQVARFVLRLAIIYWKRSKQINYIFYKFNHFFFLSK